MPENSYLQSKENIEDKLSKQIKNNDSTFVFSLLSSLTDLEQRVISALYQLNKASTIKNIRDTFVINTSILSSSNNKTFLDKQVHKLTFGFPFPTYYYAHESFPSFERIDRCIKSLIKLQLVRGRATEQISDEKVKGLYFLNILLKMNLDIEKEKQKKELKQYAKWVTELNQELALRGSTLRFEA